MEDLECQKSDALGIKFPLFGGSWDPPAAASATDAPGEPLHHVEAKAGLFAVVGLGAPSGVAQGVRSLASLSKRISAIMGSISSRNAETSTGFVFHLITDQEVWWKEFGF